MEGKKILKFIEDSFDFSHAIPDQKAVQLGGIEEYILRILKSSKLRIGRYTPELDEMLRKKIRYSILENIPITLVPAVGGFKRYDCLSFPHIDFAELMQLQFLLKNVIEIASVYKPGIIIEYSFDAYALCVIDNYKTEWIDTYINGFRVLLDHVQKKLPKNVSLRATSFNDFYSLEEMEEMINNNVMKTKSNPKYIHLVEERYNHAKNDFVLKGLVDYSGTSEKDQEMLITESIWKHKAWLDSVYDNQLEYIEGKERIPVAHRYFPGCLSIKPISGSDIQFWVANGVFVVNLDEISFKLMSPKMCKDIEIEKEAVQESVFGVDQLREYLILRR